jgi:hypothetical protein
MADTDRAPFAPSPRQAPPLSALLASALRGERESQREMRRATEAYPLYVRGTPRLIRWLFPTFSRIECGED